MKKVKLNVKASTKTSTKLSFTSIKDFKLQGQKFELNTDGNLNLTELWKLAGANKDKKPSEWLRWKPSKEFINTIKNLLPIGDVSPPLLSIKKGRYGGTFAHPQIFLAYAKWVSTELHAEVNDVFLRAKSGDMSLVNEIIDAHLLKTPQRMIDLWGIERAKGKLARLHFAGTLVKHGVNRDGFAQCTNSLYTGAFGDNAQNLKDSRSLTPQEFLRDNMNKVELTAINIAESLASLNIDRNEREGLKECNQECFTAGDLASQIVAVDTKTT